MQLVAEHKRLLTLVGCIRGIVLEFDADARYVNAWADDPKLLARQPQEMIGMTIDEVLGAAIGAPFTAMVKRIHMSGVDEHLEYPIVLDGVHRWFFADVKRVGTDHSGYTVVFFAREITDRRAAEEALARSEERYRLALQATNDVLWDWDLVNDTVGWGGAVVEQLGYESPGTASAWWKETIHPDDRASVGASIIAALDGTASTWSESYRFRRANGTYADFVDRGFIMRDAQGRAVRMVGSMTDVTQINRLQAQLLRTDRLAALGTLSAGVAHEINNPLTFVLGNLEAALDELPPDSQLREPLDEARSGAKRISAIVKALHTFTRTDSPNLRPIDLAPLLEAAISMADPEIRHRAQLVREVTRLPRVRGNESQLAQLFLNLLLNAAQAIPAGNVAHRSIRVTAKTVEGHVQIEISDDGVGIAPENLRRVFDPFFTTKGIGGGIGLGLSICHGIVEKHAGTIVIESRPGRGTQVTVRLPAIAETRSEPRVLLIDDEPQIGRLITRVYGSRARVSFFTDPRAALAQLMSGEAFDVILCDLMMPHMTGIDLYEELSRLRPEVLSSMYFMTGGAFTPRAEEFVAKLGERCLGKPIEREQLLALLEITSSRAA